MVRDIETGIPARRLLITNPTLTDPKSGLAHLLRNVTREFSVQTSQGVEPVEQTTPTVKRTQIMPVGRLHHD